MSEYQNLQTNSSLFLQMSTYILYPICANFLNRLLHLSQTPLMKESVWKIQSSGTREPTVDSARAIGKNWSDDTKLRRKDQMEKFDTLVDQFPQQGTVLSSASE